MSSHLFRRLRRCRVLFALALCAWLAMGSAARANPDCCASMTMHAATAMHADHQAPPPYGHAAGGDACSCAHAAIDRLTPEVVAAGFPGFGQVYRQALPQNAPQPGFAPPLRPPSV